MYLLLFYFSSIYKHYFSPSRRPLSNLPSLERCSMLQDVKIVPPVRQPVTAALTHFERFPHFLFLFVLF